MRFRHGLGFRRTLMVGLGFQTRCLNIAAVTGESPDDVWGRIMDEAMSTVSSPSEIAWRHYLNACEGRPVGERRSLH